MAVSLAPAPAWMCLCVFRTQARTASAPETRVESFNVVAASLCAWGPKLVDEYFIDWWKLIQQEADAPTPAFPSSLRRSRPFPLPGPSDGHFLRTIDGMERALHVSCMR